MNNEYIPFAGEKLTKEKRNALPKSHFAVPETEQLPINDITHVGMAWKMVDKTQGLTDAQRSRARKRILRRAHELGVDTSNWDLKAEDSADLDAAFTNEEQEELKHLLQVEEKEHHMQFNAMAIELPDVQDHPNKTPFAGVLTRLDEPSDSPLGGSHGRRVILPKEVAEKSLPSLLGMAIDFSDDLSSHNAKQKIGLITEATIQGNAIHISGFFYGADFPTEVGYIKAQKSRMGFSYEAQVNARPMNNGLSVITSCIFTGAAVLYKDKAAYQTTSLTANADEEIIMSKEILDALAAMAQRLEKIEAASATKVQANGIYAMVEPHVKALHAAADSMCAAGFGNDPNRGHAKMVRNVANHMMAEAAAGRTPHIFQTDNWLTASAETDQLKAMEDKIAGLETRLADSEKARFAAAAEPERKTATVVPADPTVATKVTAAGAEKGITEKDLDAELDAKGIKDPAARIQYKLKKYNQAGG